MTDKLQKNGELARSKEGEFLLVNEDEQLIQVDEGVIAVWDRCDGDITSDELAEEISAKTDQDKEKTQEAVDRIVDELKKVNLLEVSE